MDFVTSSSFFCLHSSEDLSSAAAACARDMAKLAVIPYNFFARFKVLNKIKIKATLS